VTHRDIKPSNILIDKDGRVKIVDFGLATIEGTDKLTKIGSTVGTLHYMSPEQTRGEEVDHRSDMFSVGVVLYEMITGQLPFRGDHQPAILHAIGYEEPDPIARYATGAPDELQRIISKMLAKDRSLRYRHADELLTDLRRLIILIDDSGQLQRKSADVTQIVRLGAVSNGTRGLLMKNSSGVRFPIPELPHAPRKIPLIAGFLIALVGTFLLTIWTPRSLRYYNQVTTSPSDAEAKSLDLLKQQQISLFGFHAHTYRSNQDNEAGIIRALRLPKSDFETLDSWSPSFSYLSRVISADGHEYYDINSSGIGTIFSFYHSLRPDIRPDNISADSARIIAGNFSKDVFGIQLSDLKEMPVSVTKSAEGMVTSLQWVMEQDLPGNAIAEVRASFVGSHLTSIRRMLSFPEVVKETVRKPWDLGQIVAIILTVLAFILLCIIATKEKAWHFPSRKLTLFIAAPIIVLLLLGIKPFYYASTSIESVDMAFTVVLMVVMGFAGAAFLILSVAATFGIVEREKPTILSGLQEALAGRIAGGVVINSMAVGLIAGALAVVVRTAYVHSILTAYSVDFPMFSIATGGTRFTEVVNTLIDVITSLGFVSLATVSAIVATRYLRSGAAGWILVVIVWASIDGSFLSPDGLKACLAISYLIPVALSMWVVWKYSLLAGILAWSGYETLTSGLSLSSFGVSYFSSLGYVWLGIWLFITTISVFYVIKRDAPGRPGIT